MNPMNLFVRSSSRKKPLLLLVVTAFLFVNELGTIVVHAKSSGGRHNHETAPLRSNISPAGRDTSTFISSRVTLIEVIDNQLKTTDPESDGISELNARLHQNIKILFLNETDESVVALARFLLNPSDWPFAYDSILRHHSPMGFEGVATERGIWLQKLNEALVLAAKLSGKSFPEILKPSLIDSVLPDSSRRRPEESTSDGNSQVINILASAKPDQLKPFLLALTPYEAGAVVMSVLDNSEELYPFCDQKTYLNSNLIVGISKNLRCALTACYGCNRIRSVQYS